MKIILRMPPSKSPWEVILAIILNIGMCVFIGVLFAEHEILLLIFDGFWLGYISLHPFGFLEACQEVLR